MDKNNKLRLALFVAQFPVLSETFVIRQVSGLINQGHDVTVIAGEWGDRSCAHEIYVKEQLENRVVVIRSGLKSRKLRFQCVLLFILKCFCSLKGIKALYVALRALLNGASSSMLDISALFRGNISGHSLGNFDSIIAHFGPMGVRAMNLKRAGMLNGELMVIMHGSDMSDLSVISRYKKSYQQLFNDARKILPISDYWRNRLSKWGAQPEKIEVVRMGVDINKLTMLDPNRSIANPLRVLSVARFTEKKGLRYAIEGVLSAKAGVHFQIVGAGPLEGELRKLGEKSGPGKNIDFLGAKSQQEVFELLTTADIFLLPSITASSGDMEGIPVALMEAMARGVVVLTTRHSGIPELVENGVSGFLVEERDSNGIARVIDRIVSGEYDLPSIRIAARNKVCLEYNNSSIDVQMTKIIKNICVCD